MAILWVKIKKSGYIFPGGIQTLFYFFLLFALLRVLGGLFFNMLYPTQVLRDTPGVSLHPYTEDKIERDNKRIRLNLGERSATKVEKIKIR